MTVWDQICRLVRLCWPRESNAAIGDVDWRVLSAQSRSHGARRPMLVEIERRPETLVALPVGTGRHSR